MRKPYHTILVIFLLLQFSAFAQTGRITGTVTDSLGHAVASASVSLLKNKALVQTTSTDSLGKYVFENIKDDSLVLEVSRIDMGKYTSEAFAYNSATGEMAIPAVILIPHTSTLSTVVVRGKKQTYEYKNDRTIVNVDAMISAAGISALEVLQQSPGVVVNSDGSLTVKGKQGVTVYIDNKPSNLSGQDLANYLRSLPSETISRMEIMPNPPARYDAAGNAGIINIVSKKIFEKGFNGSITGNLGQGVYWKASTNGNFNYRYNKINLFGNLSYGINNDFVDEDNLRLFTNPNGTLNAKFVQTTFLKKERRTTNIKLGMDYLANAKTTWGFLFTGIDRPVVDSWVNRNDLLNALLQTDSTIISNNRNHNRWRQAGVNVNMRRTLDASGRTLTADVDYLRYWDKTDQTFLTNTYGGDGSFRRREELLGFLPNELNIYSGKIDYTHPFTSGVKMSGGIKMSHVKTHSQAEYFNRVGSDLFIDNDKTNSFKYDETVNAAYIEASREYKRVDLQAGLRVENTVINGHQLGNTVKPDSTFKRNYTNLFPTFFIQWRLDSLNKHVISFNYGRRIQRPVYQSLNPFLFFSDKFTYEAGNPYQTPQFTHVLSLSHTFKERYSTTLSYSYIKDLFAETSEKQGYVLITRPDNVGRQINLGLSFSASVNIAKWWTANFSTDLINADIKSIVYGVPLDTNITYLTANLTNQLPFKKGWAAEVSASGRTGNLAGQYTLDPLWSLNIAARKSVMKNKGAIRLSIRDVFYSSVVKGQINNLVQAQAFFSNRIDSRMVILSFNYRFGSAFKAPPRYESNVSEDEKNRVKNN
jgi:hypothetical protein